MPLYIVKSLSFDENFNLKLEKLTLMPLEHTPRLEKLTMKLLMPALKLQKKNHEISQLKLEKHVAARTHLVLAPAHARLLEATPCPEDDLKLQVGMMLRPGLDSENLENLQDER